MCTVIPKFSTLKPAGLTVVLLCTVIAPLPPGAAIILVVSLAPIPVTLPPGLNNCPGGVK